MHLDQLKKGLWGYRKDSVFQYIASQEEVFSQKLLEKDAQAEGAARQYQGASNPWKRRTANCGKIWRSTGRNVT